VLAVFAVEGIPEIVPGDDLAAIIGAALDAARDAPGAVGAPAALGLTDGDILAVTSKIVSKAEGRVVEAADREQAITDETVRIVATRQHPGSVTRIVENRLGMVSAAAGVDASNTPEGTVLLLPLDPDASAARLRAALEQRFGVRIGVIVTDTVGRPWRQGQTDVAIGASGVRLLDDLRGTLDAHGRRLDVTTPAVGDEIAAAADLVKGKSAGLPVAVVRGLGHLLDEAAPGARVLIRPAEADMFRLGSDEAWQQGFEAARAQVEAGRAASSVAAPAEAAPLEGTGDRAD
jgi:coenzyme F420-0:L-glutamate ligase/coenzyme F420-1:gamma-L-glutamate ligase